MRVTKHEEAQKAEHVHIVHSLGFRRNPIQHAAHSSLTNVLATRYHLNIVSSDDDDGVNLNLSAILKSIGTSLRVPLSKKIIWLSTEIIMN